MSKKGCELCSNPARMFCESDQASLCWDCDEKVHAANFLVAKHSRTLLCHACQSPTPWSAAGPRVGTCVSVCRGCADRGAAPTSQRRVDEEDTQESESDDGEYHGDVSEEGENQVVPWSTSSSEENESSSSTSKRTRDGPVFDSEDEDGCCSSPNPKLGAPRLNFRVSDENYASSRPLKMPRKSIDAAALIPSDQAAGSTGRIGTTAIVEKLQRIQRQVVAEEEGGASAIILGLGTN